jgi:hypothetical protein
VVRERQEFEENLGVSVYILKSLVRIRRSDDGERQHYRLFVRVGG